MGELGITPIAAGMMCDGEVHPGFLGLSCFLMLV